MKKLLIAVLTLSSISTASLAMDNTSKQIIRIDNTGISFSFVQDLPKIKHKYVKTIVKKNTNQVAVSKLRKKLKRDIISKNFNHFKRVAYVKNCKKKCSRIIR